MLPLQGYDNSTGFRNKDGFAGAGTHINQAATMQEMIGEVYAMA